MTRGVWKTSPGPRMVAAGRALNDAKATGRTNQARARSASFARECRQRFGLALAIGLAVLLILALPRPSRAAKEAKLPAGVISEVKIEGNVSVTSEKVRGKLLSKPGSPLDARTIDADIKSLMATKWFSDVTPWYESDKRDASGKSFLLFFTVKEMPILTKVEFRGRTHVKLKEIEQLTGLKVGERADATRTNLAVGQVKRLYEEKGFELAEVNLLKGGNLGDTQVVISIFEGPKHYIASIDFKGNVFANDSMLKTKIGSRTRMLGLMWGKYHRDALEEDVRKLKEYYQSLGFFEVQVTPVTRSSPTDLGAVHVEFDVSEGTRYKVRNIAFEGNKKVKTQALRQGLALHSGQPLLDTVKDADRKTLMSRYNAIGCIDTQINPEPRYTDQPGVVDIVYHIEEGEPYLVGNIDIKGNERTKDKVIRREFAMAGVLPGELLDANRLDTAKKRLGNLQFFQNAPDQGKSIDIRIVNRRAHDKPFGDIAPVDALGGVSRMQGPEIEPAPPTVAVPRVTQGFAPRTAPAATPNPFGGAGEIFNPQPDTPPIAVPIPPTLPGAAPSFVPGANGKPNAPAIGTGEPPGVFPNFPGMNANDVGPDRGDAFPNRSFADIVTSVEEAPTGRFMIGVGASSYQGLMGNLTVYEKNFDIFNVPRSWNDLIGGNAFRGAGQTFKLELMPGTLINRFQMTLTQPYLFDLPIGASAAGYLFNRIYPNWTESRGGGRFSLGKQFGTQTYADVAVRAEEINFYGYTSPAPADYLAASGHTNLFSIRPSLRFDNRNSPFMTNKGQYLEFSFEQAFGSFTYPKAEIEGRTYITTGQRPDGSGKRILTMRGHVGATGRDTPVYERFFAGNFGSLRGFQYRGVGPRELDKNVGGIFEALGSVEYQIPLTANDMFNQVVFCDFGSVESDYRVNNLRVSVGTGLRMIIPAFGPLPLCFDLAFPIEKAAGDRVQFFNFTIGAFY